MHLRRQTVSSRARGFSLIEVLVAMLVISIGLLGIAKMQALALSNTNGGRLRALAAIETHSLGDTMGVERNYWGNLATALTVTIVGTPGATATTAGSSTITSTDSTQQGTVTCTVPTATAPLTTCTGTIACTSTASPCTAQQIAAYDLQQWAGRVQQLMGAVNTSISCSALTATTQVTCQITLTWAEQQVNSNSSETGTMASPTYIYGVNP